MALLVVYAGHPKGEINSRRVSHHGECLFDARQREKTARKTSTHEYIFHRRTVMEAGAALVEEGRAEGP